MILVTGSTGMIGRAVVRRLLNEGLRVRAHGRSEQSLKELFPAASYIKDSGAGIVEFALCDLESMSENDARRLCSGCSTVIHCAGLVHKPRAPEELYELCNVRASKLLCDSAAASGVEQFILLSSSSVYGNRAADMLDESAELCADTFYAASKIAAEKYLASLSNPVSRVVLRPALVFGEGDRGNMIALIKQIRSGKYFMVGKGAARKSLICADDLAYAVSLVIKNPPPGFAVFNIAEPEPVSVKILSESILAACGKKRAIPSLPGGLVSAASILSGLILGELSPLSPERLGKLTRDNTLSVSAFLDRFGSFSELNLSRALAAELDWAAREGLI